MIAKVLLVFLAFSCAEARIFHQENVFNGNSLTCLYEFNLTIFCFKFDEIDTSSFTQINAFTFLCNNRLSITKNYIINKSKNL